MSKIRKVKFMLGKLATDLRRLSEPFHELETDVDSPELGYYYIKFKENRVTSGKDQKLISKFDENGIPINKTYIDVTDKEYVYFPISIGQLGLAVFHTYLESKKENDKLRFLKFADWFVENASISKNLGAIWYTDVDLPAYRRKGPWQSAFSQARALNILLRAYQLTKDDNYKNLADQALVPFTIEVKDGGVVSETEWGPFYEEYPTSETPTLVLNGMIFALWGIKDYLRVFPESKIAQGVFNNGLSTLIKILPEFDLGYWSRYNLCPIEWYPEVDPATVGYQKLHISQLKVMSLMNEDKKLPYYADRFKSQMTLLNILRMYKSKRKSLKQIGRL